MKKIQLTLNIRSPLNNLLMLVIIFFSLDAFDLIFWLRKFSTKNIEKSSGVNSDDWSTIIINVCFGESEFYLFISFLVFAFFLGLI